MREAFIEGREIKGIVGEEGWLRGASKADVNTRRRAKTAAGDLALKIPGMLAPSGTMLKVACQQFDGGHDGGGQWLY